MFYSRSSFVFSDGNVAADCNHAMEADTHGLSSTCYLQLQSLYSQNVMYLSSSPFQSPPSPSSYSFTHFYSRTFGASGTAEGAVDGNHFVLRSRVEWLAAWCLDWSRAFRTKV